MLISKHNQFLHLNITITKLFTPLIKIVDITILLHHNITMNDSLKEQSTPSSIDEVPQTETNQPIDLDTDTHPTESEPRKNPRMGIIFACTILFFIIAIFLYRLIYPWKPNANTQPTPDTDNVSNQEESESSSSDNEQQESDSAEHSYQKPQEIVYDDVTIDTLIGTLSCNQLRSNPNNKHCHIPNEKIINAIEGYHYELSELIDDETLFNKQFGDAISITIDQSDQKQVTVAFLETSNYGWGVNLPPNTTYTFNFTEKVTRVKITPFGQASGYEHIFFVLENGELWQIKVSDLADGHYEAKVIPNISNVTTVLQGSVFDGIGGGACPYAIRSDGLAYYLSTSLFDN